MTDLEQKKAAKVFAERWKGKGYEKGEAQKYWMELLQKVYGIEDPFSFVEFEEPVKTEKKTTDFIDVVIPSTKILIEQKSIEVELDKAVKQTDGQLLTPYDQARKYYNNLPKSKLPDYIITCNFKQFNIYDMEKPNGQPETIFLDELETDYYRLKFIINPKSELLQKEEKISKEAGDLIGEIYDAFSNELDMEDKENQRIVNVLCVRLVFCLYAEDAQLFNKNLFYEFIKNSDVNHIQNDLYDLFKVLKSKERDSFTRRDLLEFPYVNGGLFNEEVPIPYFTEEIYSLLLNKACKFNWSDISPTIFGSIFESTLNPETRRNNGMHYTSVENIHKVIDPLFLNSLRDEFFSIKSVRTRKDKRRQLLEFQNKIANLYFLDPACGSGNFLTESYRSLRELENEIITELIKLEGKREGQLTFGTDELFDPIKVSIQQFYGIEVNDFAVSVARTALWIEEAQMFAKTQLIVVDNSKLDNFLPLDPYDNIIETNALRIDWNEVLSNQKCNYVMGNPPFVGARLMTDEQKNDVNNVFAKIKNNGNLDYVACWYKKASEYIKNTKIEVALVSTNSITQGEQPFTLFKPLFDEGIIINYAFRTFRWDSEANIKAHVHCVIVGFSYYERKEKFIYNNTMIKKAKNINAYLVDSSNFFIENRTPNLCNVSPINYGSFALDDGHYTIDEEEYNDIISRDPGMKSFLKYFIGARELLHSEKRYCVWLLNESPEEIKKHPILVEKIKKVRDWRAKSSRKKTVELSETPTLFAEIRQPKTNYLAIPTVSSENRKYIPLLFLKPDVIASNQIYVIPDANLYMFGILMSNVHMAWIKAVAGRLKSDYRYSSKVVYNNFPWPSPSEEEIKNVEKTAQMILDARKCYPNCSLADMYDDNMLLYPELKRAHQLNDKAVWEAYGKKWAVNSESECMYELIKMYQNLVNNDNN